MMKNRLLPVFARPPLLAALLVCAAALSLLGACAPAGSGSGSGGASGTGGSGSGSGGATGSGGAGGAPSCTGSIAGAPTMSDVREVIHFYCGGGGCHNEGRAPALFEDANLHTLLTTYKVAGCGNRTLVVPCKPEDSAFYRVQKGECETVERMPKGCSQDTCVYVDDLETVRKWIANGALKQ